MKTTYTVDEICQILRISKPTAYALVKSGVFSSIKFKNTIRVLKKVLISGWKGNLTWKKTNLKGMDDKKMIKISFFVLNRKKTRTA